MVAFEGESLRLCFRRQEELLHISDVKGGVGVKDDDVVEVSSDAVEALGDLVDDLDEPAWNSACLLYTSPSPRDKRQSRMPSSA